MKLEISKYIPTQRVNISFRINLNLKAKRMKTYDSRPRITAAWITAVITKSHVHFEFGRYILLTRSGPWTCL